MTHHFLCITSDNLILKQINVSPFWGRANIYKIEGRPGRSVSVLTIFAAKQNEDDYRGPCCMQRSFFLCLDGFSDTSHVIFDG